MTKGVLSPYQTTVYCVFFKRFEATKYFFCWKKDGLLENSYHKCALVFRAQMHCFLLTFCINGYIDVSRTVQKVAKKEPSLLHTYVLNEFLTADNSWATKYFWKSSYRSWYLISLSFFWHLLHQDWSIFEGTASFKNVYKR